jgi:predicted metal-dependent peptidase
MKTAEERITQSRVRLLLTKPFFGTLATRLRLSEVDHIPTAGTDGRKFYFNREFINRLDDKELDFLVGHEVLHCVFDHMEARGDRDPQLYNVAADFNINMTLVEQNIGTVIGKDKLNGGEACLDWKYRGMNSYEIYDQLVQEGAGGNSMDYHFELGDGDAGEGDDGNKKVRGMTEAERKALTDEIKQAVLNAAQQAGGEVPENIKRMIADLVAPKMDWREVLRTTLESSIKHDFTFMRPSKRSGEVIFPGMNRDEELNVAVALDTSGSISPDMLRDFLSEVQGIMGQYSSYKITLFQFDTSVYGCEVFTADDGRDLKDYTIQGGGGTDFDAVYAFMERNDIHPDQLVMFTDGYPWGSWGNADYCDTLFVVHGDPQHRIQSPFGVTIHYDN